MKQKKVIKRLYRRLTKASGSFMTALVVCFTAVIALALVIRSVGGKDQKDVYAAADTQTVQTSSQPTPPPGIAGALSGVTKTHEAGDEVKRIGTSCEEVIVGQRMTKIESVGTMDASTALEQTVGDLSYTAKYVCAQSSIMSDNDYETLLAIVEAEAGGEDLEGRIMVANVILNRVSDSRFPDNVYDVVWEVVDGMAQFSPTADGRINSVTISDETKEAVHAAIEGKDNSQGALFFVAKDQANPEYVKWFDKDLVPLFEHGVHSFYTYPEG